MTALPPVRVEFTDGGTVDRLVTEIRRVDATLGKTNQTVGRTATGFAAMSGRMGIAASQTSSYAQGLANLKVQQESLVNQQNKIPPSVDKTTNSFVQQLASLRRLAVGYGVFKALNFANDALEEAAALHDLAQKTGATVEALSVLQFVGKRNDITAEDLSISFRQLSKSLSGLRQGGKEATEAFANIGMRAKDLEGLTVDQAFLKIVRAIAGLPAGFDKAAVATEIFGRSGANLIPLINEIAERGMPALTRETQKAGAAMTADGAAAADKFKDSLSNMGAAAAGAARAILIPLLPYMTLLFEAAQELFSRKPGDTLKNDFLDIARVVDKVTGGVFHLSQKIKDLNGVRAGSETPSPDTKPPPPPVTTPILSDTARRTARLAAFARELADQKNANAIEQEANERQFAESLQSLKAFYDRKRGLAQEATAAEAKAIQGELAVARSEPAFGLEEQSAKKAKILNLEQKLQDVRAAGELQVQGFVGQEFLARKALTEERLQAEQRVLTAQGQTFAAARVGIELEAQKLDESLVKQGVRENERRGQVQRLTDLLTKRAEFAKDEEEASRRLADLDREREAIQLRVQTGQITASQGEEQIAALELRRLPILRQIAEHAMRLAQAIGDPALIQAAAELNANLDGVAAGADLAGQRMAQFKADVEGAITNDLADFFSHGITEAKSFGDAIKGLARSIAQSIQNIVAQLIAAQIVKSIAGAIFGGGGGFAGGGLVRGKGEILTGQGFASGGFVSGAGGPTSDSIPAYLSNGEYVVNAAATSRNLPLLQQINARPLHLQSFSSRGYAAGGLVTTAPTSPGNVTLHVTHEEGTVVRIVDKNMPVLVQNHRKHIRDTTR